MRLPFSTLIDPETNRLDLALSERLATARHPHCGICFGDSLVEEASGCIAWNHYGSAKLGTAPVDPVFNIKAQSALAALLVRPLGHRPVDSLEHSLGAAELSAVLAASRSEGLIEGFEHDLLASALHLGSRPVTSVMIPRSEMVVVDRRMTLAEIEDVIVTSGHSRLVVSGAGPDDLVGFFHVKDLFRLPPEAQDEPIPLELRRQMLVVEPDLPLDDLLLRMRRARSHLARVRESNGSTVGLVTMEDVIEELVGDIRDESDAPAPGA